MSGIFYATGTMNLLRTIIWQSKHLKNTVSLASDSNLKVKIIVSQLEPNDPRNFTGWRILTNPVNQDNAAA